MRDLTPDERATLARRHAGFDRYFQESMPVLVDFCERLGLKEPYRVLNEPSDFLPAIDSWLSRHAGLNEPHPEDRNWLVARLGYYVGYLLVQRFGGAWFLDEDSESRYFLRYVVGQFPHWAAARVDPNQVAADFIDGLEGDSFGMLYQRVADEAHRGGHTMSEPNA